MQWELNVQGWDHTAHSKGSNMLEMRQSSGEGRQATTEVWAAVCKVICEPAGPEGCASLEASPCLLCICIYNSDSEQS